MMKAAISQRTAIVRLGTRSEQALNDLRTRLIGHIHRISLADHNDEQRGALVARVTSDIETLTRFFQWGGLAWLIDGTLMMIVAAVVLLGVLDEPDFSQVPGCHRQHDRVADRLVETVMGAVLEQRRLVLVSEEVVHVAELVIDHAQLVVGLVDAHLDAQVVAAVEAPGACVAYDLAVLWLRELGAVGGALEHALHLVGVERPLTVEAAHQRVDGRPHTGDVELQRAAAGEHVQLGHVDQQVLPFAGLEGLRGLVVDRVLVRITADRGGEGGELLLGEHQEVVLLPEHLDPAAWPVQEQRVAEL